MTNPLFDSFWRDERAYLWDAIEPLTMRALLAGAEGAAALLPAEIAPLVEWDFFNRAALRYLGQYRLSTVAGINATTQQQAIEAINEWVRSGQGIQSLKTKLRPIFGQTRAGRIASTETTRIFSAGNQALWESTGVVSGKRVMTARDERVCVICGPMHGKIVELQGEFTLDANEIANSPQMRALGLTGADALNKATSLISHAGASHQYPPFHVQCRCWTSPIVSEELLRDEIGDILAQQFFAKVRAGKVDAFISSTRTRAARRTQGR